TSGAKAFVTNVTAGDKIVIAEWNGRSGGPFSVSSVTNSGTAALGTWTNSPSSLTTSTRKAEIWRAHVTGSGTCTVTVNMSGGTDLSFTVSEFSGMPTVATGDIDATSGTAGTSATASTSPTTPAANTA